MSDEYQKDVKCDDCGKYTLSYYADTSADAHTYCYSCLTFKWIAPSSRVYIDPVSWKRQMAQEKEKKEERMKRENYVYVLSCFPLYHSPPHELQMKKLDDLIPSHHNSVQNELIFLIKEGLVKESPNKKICKIGRSETPFTRIQTHRSNEQLPLKCDFLFETTGLDTPRIEKDLLECFKGYNIKEKIALAKRMGHSGEWFYMDVENFLKNDKVQAVLSKHKVKEPFKSPRDIVDGSKLIKTYENRIKNLQEKHRADIKDLVNTFVNLLPADKQKLVVDLL